MKYLILLVFISTPLIGQTQNEVARAESTRYQFDLQGHRGARGLAPENTMQAFRKAIELGVNTLELDLVLTKDNQIIVSHEPWINADICYNSNGHTIEKTNETSFNMYQMTYDEVKSYDCGSKYNPAFPEQSLEYAHKPLLKEVLHMADSLSKSYGREIKYNIEIKSLPQGDLLFHPKPVDFVKLVMDLLQKETNLDNVNLQSFDFRVLKEINTSYPKVKLAALVYDKGMDVALTELGFVPDIYSPYFPLVSESLVNEAHKMGMKVIPWTVNETEQMKTLLNYGVDGLITDYPNRALNLRE